jgi:spore germination protein
MVHGAAAQTEDSKAAAIHPKTGRYVAAWLPTTFDARDARASFEENKDVLDEVSPFWYGVRSDGRLLADTGSRDMELVRTAHENNVLVIPTVHNIGNEDVAANVIENPTLRARNIQSIVDEVLKYGYDGFDIDYEGLSRDTRPAFSDFILGLSAELHKHDKLLTIAVHAKSQDYGGLGGFQDWAVIGPAVDRLRIMTYDYHWRGGGAGPISPIYWVEEVSEYAMSVVEPSKIVIGIPFYAYNWAPGERLAAAQTGRRSRT